MPTRDIKTRFKLEGEQEFKRAMSDAASAVKVLNSEEKLAKAQFEATGDAQQYAADQARILKEQIDHQKKSVAAAEEAIKRLTDNGVDKNSRQMQTWKTKLNNAKTSLYQMQRRLDMVGTELGEENKAFGDTETAGKNFQEQMEKVATGINLQNAITAVDSIKSHIEQIVATAARAAKAMWDMGVEGSVWADNLATAANEAGVDVETYQSWQYASRFIDTSVDDIVRNWKDIDSKMNAEGDALRDYLELLNSVGIASADANGLRQGADIFWEMIDYLHGIGDEGERTRQALTLFGNDWRKLNPLITAGSAAYKEMAEQGRAVAVVSEENVNALGSMNDSYEDMSSALTKLKMDTLAELAPVFNDVADALKKAILALDEFVQSEEGQQALGELNNALSGLISAFLGEDNGKGTFESIVKGAKDAVQKLAGALRWLSNNGETIAGIIAGMGAAWATLTVTKEVLTFIMLLRALPLDKLTTLFSGGKGLTASTGGSTLSGGGGSIAPATAKTSGTGLIAGLRHMAGAAAPYLTVAGVTAGFGAVMDRWSTEKNYGEYNRIIEKMKGSMGLASEKAEGLRQNILALRDAWGQGSGEGVTAGREFFAANAAEIYNQMPDLAIFERWKDVFDEVGDFSAEKMEKFIGVFDPETGIWDSTATFAAHWEDFIREYTEHAADLAEAAETSGTDAGEAITDGLAESIVEEAPVAEEASEGLIDTVAEAAQEKVDYRSKGTAFEVLGEMIDSGLAQGIYNNADEALEAIYWLSRRVAAGSRAILSIHSPSKVFEEIGQYVGEGFAQGIDESVGAVDRAMGRMMSATTRRPVRGSGAALEGAGAGAGAGDMVHVTLVLDDEVLGDVMAPIINDRIGARIAATRR